MSECTPDITPRILKWDSAHFGIPLARIEALDITPKRIVDDLAFLRDRGVILVEAFCPATAPATVQFLEHAGFRLAGVKVYLHRDMTQRDVPLPVGTRMRMAETRDTAEIVALFGDLFVDSRYFAYPGLPDDRVRELYRVWLANAVTGQFDDCCLVLENEGEILAVATLKFSGQTARIGLFGVNPAYRRCGHGRQLLASLDKVARPRGARILATATQGANLPALRLYEGAGFLTQSVELCFVTRLD